MIEFDRVNVHYGKNHVLHDLTAKIEVGEVVALIGANAAGKTTALRTALGLKNLSSGSLRFAGEDVSSLSTHERVERGLILVPEGRQVFVKFTVTENLLMGAYHRNDRNKVQVELDHVYDLFPRLRERKSQKAGSMSGGEQQMLAIGRGLMAKPKCLLLDEPTMGLAPIIVQEILTILGKLAANGITILLAEQNASMALECASRAYVIESGHISLAGTSESLRESATIKSLYLGH
jgi:branched-chain amino acid transport system ATP-binding protein